MHTLHPSRSERHNKRLAIADAELRAKYGLVVASSSSLEPTLSDTWVKMPGQGGEGPSPGSPLGSESMGASAEGWGDLFEHSDGSARPPVPVGECGIGPIVATLRVGGEMSSPEDLESARDMLQDWLAERLGRVQETRRSLRWYSECVEVGEWKSIMGWGPRSKQSPEDEIHIEVTQTACDGLGLERSLELLRGLLAFGARVTRIDAHRDDRAGLTSPSVARDAFLAGDVVTHVKRDGWTDTRGELRGPMVKYYKDYSTGGETVYFGSRSAPRFLRVYNGDPLHGEGTGIRWELEHKQERAEQFAELVAGSPAADFAVLVTSAIRAHVDFVDRAGDQHGSRRPMLAWWSAFVDGAARAALRMPTEWRSIERKLAWFGRSCQKSLALLTAYMGGADESAAVIRSKDWLYRTLESGRNKLTADDLALLPEGHYARRRLIALAV